MIRHPLHSAAVGRARPDLSRVADGIAASLRQFSISAQRCAPDRNDDEDRRPRPSGRQRTVAAVDEIISTMEGGPADTPRTSYPPSEAHRSFRPAEAAPPRPIEASRDAGSDDKPRFVIRREYREYMDSPRGGMRGGMRGGSSGGPSGPNIIRGGFRGRGGGASSFSRGGGASSFGRGGGGYGGGYGNSDGGGGYGSFSRGRGGGGFRGRDDRPRRSRGPRRARGSRNDEDGEGGRRKRNGREQESEPQQLLGTEPHVREYLDAQEQGETAAFNPALSLAELAGWGPAVATSKTPFGQGETVLRQARILGGGQAFHSSHLQDPLAMRLAWRDGMGLFTPTGEDAQMWTRQVMRDRVVQAPAEVKTAVLDDAMLGQYQGPQYADTNDTLGTVRSYVKRDGTWNVHAERSIEAKVSSMIGKSAPTSAPAAFPNEGPEAHKFALK
ncbi:hypothetical protein F4804DRAFT_109969 [Jackrogersella minutella]|nr:hypothetical protein F4804DRAFT_109969 [Jackrogersella minutella]